MLQRSFVVIPITMLLVLCSCTSRSGDTTSAPAGSTAIGAQGPGPTEASASPDSCPTSMTRKQAKARFAANAGLASGAFKRYIYTPYRNGAFQRGGPAEKQAVAKAGVAGTFTLDQLRRARINAQADPALCERVIPSLDEVIASTKGLVERMRRGQVDATRLGAVDGGLERFRRSAHEAGAGFRDRSVPPGMVGG